MTNEKTITVVDYHGKDKQVTRQEFQDVWLAEIAQLTKLVDCDHDGTLFSYQLIKENTLQLINSNFDLKYERQNS